MKKLIPLLLTALFVLSLAACSNGNTSQPAAPVSSAVSETTAEIPATSPAATDPAAANQSAKSADGIDVDLIAMSSTMVYSEVLNMQQTPDEYIGKIVKMKGPSTSPRSVTTAILPASSPTPPPVVPQASSSSGRATTAIPRIIPKRIRRSPSSAPSTPTWKAAANICSSKTPRSNFK